MYVEIRFEVYPNAYTGESEALRPVIMDVDLGGVSTPSLQPPQNDESQNHAEVCSSVLERVPHGVELRYPSMWGRASTVVSCVAGKRVCGWD